MHLYLLPITTGSSLTLYGKDVQIEGNEREAHILLREGLNGVGAFKSSDRVQHASW